MSASSAATSLPASGTITQKLATEILSLYETDPVVMAEEESHLYNVLANPSNHSWDGTICIGRLKTARKTDPPNSKTEHTISRVESRLALAYCPSEKPFSETADRVYFVEKPTDEQSQGPFMLFTVAGGVYVATRENTGPWATQYSKTDAEICLGGRSQLYNNWSVAKEFTFHAIKHEVGEDVTDDGPSTETQGTDEELDQQ